MADNRGIAVAYMVHEDPDTGLLLYMTGKDFYDRTGSWAHGGNKGAANEPYNYFSEIMDAMHSLGQYELMESIWLMPEGNTGRLETKRLIGRMQAKGFRMVCVNGGQP